MSKHGLEKAVKTFNLFHKPDETEVPITSLDLLVDYHCKGYLDDDLPSVLLVNYEKKLTTSPPHGCPLLHLLANFEAK